MAEDDDVLFCTLGMFILDDIYPRKTDIDQSPKLNVIGGAGTYSALGARLFCPPSQSERVGQSGQSDRDGQPGQSERVGQAARVGWILDAGTDFPQDVLRTIDSWQTGVLVRQRDDLTTRGLNEYTNDEHRAFRYLTEKKRITAEDLSAEYLRSRSYHLICSASRCQSLVTQILHRRSTALPRPLFVWEPVPDLCTAAEIDAIRNAIRHVDVVSPNHDELATLFGAEHPSGVIDKRLIETHAQRLLDDGIGQDGSGIVVVRSGKEGAYAATRSNNFWIPAYHSDQRKVIDPTGGGNGFLGGLSLGLAQRKSLRAAVQMATVAASFCIEQVGPPILDPGSETSIERWNGADVLERLASFTLSVDSRE